MSQAVLIPLFALATWMLALYADNKFRYFYEGKDAKKLASRTKGLRRTIILRNREMKYLGLGALWAGFSVGTVLENDNKHLISTAAYAAYSVGLLGLIVYITSRMWPFLSRK